MNTHQIDDAKVYAFLSQVDSPRLARWLRRLDRVSTMQRSPGGKRSKRKWLGKKNQLKGRVFEKTVQVLLAGVKSFDNWEDVTTATNQLDLLVRLGPTARFSPMLREWGTHFICECKFEDKHIGVTWVGKLNTILQTHLASVGLFVSGNGFADGGPGRKVRNLIRMLSLMTPSRFIVSIDRADLDNCAGGRNFIELLSRKYVETKTGSLLE